jgi:hypothetical protein
MNERADEFRVERYISVGCLTAVGGFFGGGMMAVLLAKIVGWFRRCEPDPGLPACDWHVYMIVGALAGLVVLPAGVFWRLKRGSKGGSR